MTIKELFQQSAGKQPQQVALRYKSRAGWEALTYAELLRRVRCVSEALVHVGIKPGDRVALFLKNSPEWVEIYLGIVSIGAIAVPVDAKLQEREVAHVLRDSEAKVLFTPPPGVVLIRDIAPPFSDLNSIVVVGDETAEGEHVGNGSCLNYRSLLSTLASSAAAADAAFERHDPSVDDVASIIYTSGTTGRPKGAMLTHANFTTNVTAALEYLETRADDNFLLVLPLHHAFAFTGNLLAAFKLGVTVSIVPGLRTVAESMQAVKPSILLAVPLLLEKMYNRIESRIAARFIARVMMACGLGRVVGRSVVKGLGGRLRLIVVGGAPCPPALILGFKRLGVTVREGYGLTETAPIVALTPQRDLRTGYVGKVIPGVDVKVLNPGEGGVGEIAVRGPNVMKGYFHNQKATAACLASGWFKTGDLGLLTDDGYVKVTGRCKSLIVNREGKNIYPEEVELCMNRSELILESLVVAYHDTGHSGEKVGAIVVPDQEAFDRLSVARNKAFDDEAIICRVREEVRRLTSDLSSYKRPRNVQVRFEEFEKTTTQKIKRYRYAIDA